MPIHHRPNNAQRQKSSGNSRKCRVNTHQYLTWYFHRTALVRPHFKNRCVASTVWQHLCRAFILGHLRGINMTQFNAKKALAFLSAIALSAGLAQTASAGQLNGDTNLASSNLQFSSKSVSGGGQWRTLTNGCSYSRAQAPGYAPTWHLIVNPQSMGLPARPRNCKPMVSGS